MERSKEENTSEMIIEYICRVFEKMKKKSILFGLLTIVAVILCVTLDAQPPLSGTTGPPCFPPPCIPIDGGTTLLVAAGLIWGGKKVFDKSKA